MIAAAQSRRAVIVAFGPASTIVAQVGLPPKTRLVGFGNGTVYLVRREQRATGFGAA